MQSYTIFFITVNALHVSGGFSAHHQEFKNCTHRIGYMPSLLVATASVGESEPSDTSYSSRYRLTVQFLLHVKHNNSRLNVKVKVNSPLEQATKAWRESRSITLLFL